MARRYTWRSLLSEEKSMRIRKPLALLCVALGASLASQAVAGTITPGPRIVLTPNEPAPNLIYKTIGYTEFFPLDSSVGYARSTTLEDGRYSTNGGGSANGTMATTIYLPSGALLQTLEFTFCSTGESGGIGLQMQVETKQGLGVVVPIMGVVGNVGCQDIVADVSGYGWTVDNFGHRLMPQVTFSVFDGSAAFSGVVIGYVLQVSPAPDTPTFGDVPTTDPGYQYIEALAASGITGGCGGGNFCPDASLTRRQMAIFLAKALGLYFH
jgi:hypothetical protein